MSFWKKEDGYVLVLMLLFMPVFVGLSLLVIDVSRGNNAQSDLYAAADALALAAARELDGGSDAIVKAKAAMLEVDNSVSLLAPVGNDTFIQLEYEDLPTNEFTVIFLKNIPADDDTPIDQAWVDAEATNDGKEAAFVLVEARSRDLSTIFFNPATLFKANVPIGASAVATRYNAACNVTPVYICNPFEDTSTGADNQALLKANFESGGLHARLFKLQPGGNQTDGPGNFGFLQVKDANGNSSPSANTLNQIFAGGYNPTCYSAGTVDTAPGAMNSLGQGINTRFDIYKGQFSQPQDKVDFAPAQNVRKGYLDQSNGGGGNACNTDLVDPIIVRDANGNPIPPYPDALAYLNNRTMVAPGGAGGTSGAQMGSDSWDFATYWEVNYAAVLGQDGLKTLLLTDPQYNSAWYSYDDDGNPATPDVVAQKSGATTTEPSRFDVYQFEINTTAMIRTAIIGDPDEDGVVGDTPDTYVNGKLYQHLARGGETGNPDCAGTPFVPGPLDRDRRLIFAAIIDCNAAGIQGASTDVPVNSFASIFMVNPLESNGQGAGNEINNDATLDVEIVGLATAGGGGQIENFVRDEAVLVR